MFDWELFDAVVDSVLQQNPSFAPPMAGDEARRIIETGRYRRTDNGGVILLPTQTPTPEPSVVPAPTPEPAPAPTPASKKRLTLEETLLRNRAVKALVAIGEKRLAKASLDKSPIGETFLGILLDAQEDLHNELMLAFNASTGVEFLEDLEGLEDPETELVPLMKRHGIVPGRWTMEFHKEVAVKQPPAQVPVPAQEQTGDAAPVVTVTEGDNGLPTINVQLVQPSTNFVVNPDGSIGEQVVTDSAVTLDNAFSLMQRVNARRNQKRNHQRNAG